MPLDVICFALKMGGALCVLTGCWGMGYFVCRGISRRLGALRELQRLTLAMAGEIRCMSETLPVILEHMAQRSGPVYRDFFESVSLALKKGHGQSLASVWNAQADVCFIGGPLNPGDVRLVKRLGEMLGSHDVQMQLSVLDLFASDLEKRIAGLGETIDSQKKVYGGLWIIGGIFVVILFI